MWVVCVVSLLAFPNELGYNEDTACHVGLKLRDSYFRLCSTFAAVALQGPQGWKR